MSSTSRLLLAGVFLTSICTAACSTCASCSSSQEAATSAGADIAEPQEPDVLEDTYAEELEEATENAKDLGDQTGFDRTTKARFVAAELEGMQKMDDRPHLKAKTRPKHDDGGQIDVAQLKRVFGNNQSALRTCYERALKGAPNLQGKVALTIRIAEGGKASMVKARSNQIADATALDCMERTAKQWNYPSPSDGSVLVNKTFEFTPQN